VNLSKATFMVFYLKYRPNKITELDSLSLQEKLVNVLTGKLPNDTPHAFLFTGPKGLGKTSTARILAKAINCTKRKEGEIEPCNKCDSCLSITNGSNLDVLEIDAASNRGIDEIRDLREKIKLAPLSSIKKIYIIDEVHMLTTEAFNAFLKTLEEPPSHAIFILCTTEAQKVPETILSRCFSIKFTKATDEDLLRSFTRITKSEGIKADKEALLQIAKLSDGSFRDGTKILEELSVNKKELTVELVEEKFKSGTVNKSVNDLILALENKDTKKGIDIVGNLVTYNVDFKFFNESLINELHKKLILQAEANDKKVTQTKEILELLAKSYMEIKYAVLPQLPLELVIVEWCMDQDLRLKIKDSGIEGEVANTRSDLHKDKDEEEMQKKVDTKSGGDDKILEDLIREIKSENFSIAGVLRGCKVEKIDNNEIVLSTEFKFHKEKLSDQKNIDLIEKSLKKNGHNLKFSVILKGE
jgi:DNA polymerase III subunit gamma/tau